jgi:hypothetical protein
MTDEPDLKQIERFVLENILDFEQLELVLLAVAEPDHIWTIESLRSLLGFDVETLEQSLAHLVARGLFVCEPRNGTFRYAPATAALAESARELARAHSSQRAQVVHMMSRNAMNRVRTAAIHTFAEAFRLRGPKG